MKIARHTIYFEPQQQAWSDACDQVTQRVWNQARDSVRDVSYIRLIRRINGNLFIFTQNGKN